MSDNKTYLDRLAAVEIAAGVTPANKSRVLDRLGAVEIALGITYTTPFVINGVTYSLPVTALDRLSACEATAGVFAWRSRQGSGGQYSGGY